MKSKHFAYLMLFLAGIFGGNEVVKMIQTENNEKVRLSASDKLNTTVTNFTLPDLDGTKHQFSEWDGKVRVLNFWATWCPPCLKETPLFVELQEQLRAKGLQFIGVAIDNHDKVKDFMDTYGINYPMLIGAENAIEIAKQYGNRFGALPYTVVINRDGKIVHAQGGEFTREKAEKVIMSLL